MEVELVLLSSMNININIKIKKKEDGYLEVSENMLLDPFYITERELLNVYLSEYPMRYISAAREIIFYNSLRADEIVGKSLDSLSDVEIFSIKRRLTLCLSIIGFGNKFNTDYTKSLSRSKTLAEFSVTTSKVNDPFFVINIIKNAEECVASVEDLINSASSGLISLFVKGALNSANLDSHRLWHHFNLEDKSNIPYASEKKFYNGKYYKNGGKFY